MIREYLTESHQDQFHYETTIKKDLDALLEQAHAYFDGSEFYRKQYNHLLKQMLEGSKRKHYGARDLGYQTISVLTESIANRADEISGKIWDYVQKNVDSPSRRHAYSQWFRELTENYVPPKSDK